MSEEDESEDLIANSDLLQDPEDDPDEDAMNLLDDVVGDVEDQELYSPDEIAKHDYADLSSGVKTFCKPLDWAISRFGFPVGRQVLLRGSEGSGKTEMGIEILKSVHREGGMTAVIDSEDTFSLDWAQSLGFKPEQNTIAKPQTCEDAWELIRKICNRIYEKKANDTPTAILWDSVSDSAVEDEMNEEIGQDSMTRGAHAGLFSQAYRQMGSLLEQTNTTLILIVHPKVDPGASPYEDNLTYIARRPIDHNSSVILHLDRGDKETGHDTRIGTSQAPRGQWNTAYVAKNKVGEPFRTITYPIYYSKGIDVSQATFNFLKHTPGAEIEGDKFEGIQGPNGGWYQLDLPLIPDDLREESFRAKNFLNKVEEWTEEYEVPVERIIDWFMLSVLQPEQADDFADLHNLREDEDNS